MTGTQSFTLDYLMACRCAYYCWQHSVTSDYAYDMLEADAMGWAPADHPLRRVGSSILDDRHYPPHVRALALYLMDPQHEREPGLFNMYLSLKFRRRVVR